MQASRLVRQDEREAEFCGPLTRDRVARDDEESRDVEFFVGDRAIEYDSAVATGRAFGADRSDARVSRRDDLANRAGRIVNRFDVRERALAQKRTALIERDRMRPHPLDRFDCRTGNADEALDDFVARLAHDARAVFAEQEVVGASDRAEDAVLARQQAVLDVAGSDRGDERVEVVVAARRRRGTEVCERGLFAERARFALKSDRYDAINSRLAAARRCSTPARCA